MIGECIMYNVFMGCRDFLLTVSAVNLSSLMTAYGWLPVESLPVLANIHTHIKACVYMYDHNNYNVLRRVTCLLGYTMDRFHTSYQIVIGAAVALLVCS